MAETSAANGQDYHDEGARLTAAGDFAAAAAAYREALRLDSEDAAAWSNLGYVLCCAGRPDAAARACKRAIAIDPTMQTAHANLGAALLSLEDPAAAEDAYRRALRLAPDDPGLSADLGRALDAQGDHAGAVAMLTTAIKAAPDRLFFRRARGLAAMRLGQFGAAAEDFLVDLHALARSDVAPPTPPKRATMNRESAQAAYHTARAALTTVGAPGFLAFGTLLGHIRENDFIGHDRDIDLGLMQANALRVGKDAIVSAMTEHGFRQIEGSVGNRAINLAFAHASGIAVDLYEHFEADGQIVSGIEVGGDALLWAFTPFALIETHWQGAPVLMPGATERYLAEAYGDWRRPEPRFEATFWAPNVVGGFPPLSRCYAYLKTLDALREGDRETTCAHLDRILALDPKAEPIAEVRLALKSV